MRKELAAVVILAALVFIFHAKLFFPTSLYTSQDFSRGDLTHFNYPLKEFYSQSLKSHQLPLWTDKIFTGFPIYAESQIGTFYLPNLILFYFLPTFLAFNISYLLTFFIAATGTYFYCRYLRLNYFPSLFASIAFAFSMYFVGHIIHFNLIQAGAFTPWLFLFTERIIANGKGLNSLIFSLLLSQQIFSGYLQHTMYILSAVFLLAIFRTFTEQLPKFRLMFLLSATISGFLLAAVQIIPSWEFIKQSIRPSALPYQYITLYPFKLKDLLYFLHPYFFGDPSLATFQPYLPKAGIFWENNAYIGILPLLFTIYLPAIIKKEKTVILFLILFILTVIFAFVFGLALTNHHTIVFLAPALVFLILATNRKFILAPKQLVILSLFLILGLLPYIYLPVRALQNPVLNWGDPETLGSFIHHVLRRDYGTFSFGAGAKPNPFNLEVVSFYSQSLFWNFVTLGILLAILGLISFFKEKKSFFFLLLAFLFLGPIFVFLSRLPIVGNIDAKGAIERFFLSSEVILAIWISLGLVKIIEKLPRVSTLIQFPFILLFLIPLLVNFSKVNQIRNFIYEDYGRKTFETLPQNSVVFVFGDRLSMISNYLQVAQGERPDLKIINITLLTDNWYKANLKLFYSGFSFPYDKFQYLKLSEVDAGENICQELIGKYSVFIENRTKAFDPAYNKYCTNRIYGNFWKLEPKDYKLTTEYLKDEYYNFWQPQISQLSSQKPYDIRTRAILLYSWSQPLTYLGVFLDENFNQKDLAHRIYLDASSISSDNAIALYLTARKYINEQNFEKAEQIEKKAIQIDPTQTEPYRVLGFLNLNWKKDKEHALYYFRKYLKYAEESQEKNQVRKLIKDLEKNP